MYLSPPALPQETSWKYVPLGPITNAMLAHEVEPDIVAVLLRRFAVNTGEGGKATLLHRCIHDSSAPKIPTPPSSI